MVEPVLSLAKTAAASNVSGSRTVTYTIAIDHSGASTSNAYDVTFLDDLIPLQMSYVPGSLQWMSGVT